MLPLIASPRSKPRLFRAASSSMPCNTDFGVGVAARFAVFETGRGTADLDIALEQEALVVAVALNNAASTFCPMIIRSAEKFVASTAIA